MSGSRELPKFMLRLPSALKQWISEQAKRNASSQNSEIVRAIQERKERVEQGRAAQ